MSASSEQDFALLDAIFLDGRSIDGLSSRDLIPWFNQPHIQSALADPNHIPDPQDVFAATPNSTLQTPQSLLDLLDDLNDQYDDDIDAHTDDPDAAENDATDRQAAAIEAHLGVPLSHPEILRAISELRIHD